MRLYALVPTLALVAATQAGYAADSAATPVVETGKDATFSIGVRMQNRIELGTAKDVDGNDADPFTGAPTDDGQFFNFNVRRLRLYMKGGYGDNLSWAYSLKNDNIGGSNGATDTAVKTEDAWIAYKLASGDLKQTIKFGFEEFGDYGHRNVEASSSSLLFPNARLKIGGDNQNVGLGYDLVAPMFNVSAALAEAASKAPGAHDAGDMFLALRVGTSLSGDMQLKKRSESYLGKDGFEHEVGISFTSQDFAGDVTQTIIGLDYNIHFNQISGLAEIQFGDKDDVKSQLIILQGAFAIPMESGAVVEPALRLTMIDNDTDTDTAAGFKGEGSVDSPGTYIDLGVNYYLAGHSNKLQAGIQIYSPEEGDAAATIFRVQHQLNF